jgi:hypothetical protein
MNIHMKQSVLKKMLLALGQDPTSEEQLDDPRLISKFISVNKLLLIKQLTDGKHGKFTGGGIVFSNGGSGGRGEGLWE